MKNKSFTFNDSFRVLVSYWTWFFLYTLPFVIVSIAAFFLLIDPVTKTLPENQLIILYIVISLPTIYLAYCAFVKAMRRSYKHFKIQFRPEESSRRFLIKLWLIYNALTWVVTVVASGSMGFLLGFLTEPQAVNATPTPIEATVVIVLSVIIGITIPWLLLHYFLNRSYKTMTIQKV